jgi:PhnB protein
MPVNHIPKGFHTVNTYLTVQNADRVLEFIKKTFDAKELMCMRQPNGTIAHAEVQIGDSVVELAEAHGQWKPLTAGLHVYVPKVDTVYKKALEAGGVSLHEVMDMFYGERSGGVRDPAGNHWFIATHTEDVPPEEMARRAATAMQNQKPHT